MNADQDIVIAGKPLPRIASADMRHGRIVHIVWHDGGEKTVDLAPALESRRVFIPLRADDGVFHRMTISEFGDALEWPGGIEFSAVWLDALPEAGFTNAEFRAAMDRLGFTLDGMASALEISRRLVADYRKFKAIPRHIGLATRYLVEHHARMP